MGALLAKLLVLAAAASVAPGAPGASGTWTTGAKQGIGTSTTLESKLWYTLANGGLSEVYYPRVDVPQVRDLQLVVGDGSTLEPEEIAAAHRVELADPQALAYRQVSTAAGRYRITKTYVTDPARATLLVQVRLESLDGRAYKVYVRYDPSLGGSAKGDSGTASGDALLASEGTSASALVATPSFARVTT